MKKSYPYWLKYKKMSKPQRKRPTTFFVGGRVCKVCGVKYLPVKGSFRERLRLCHLHRKDFWKNRYKYLKEWYKKYPHQKEANYKLWKEWVVKNLEKRRAQALQSYHRRKGFTRRRKDV